MSTFTFIGNTDSHVVLTGTWITKTSPYTPGSGVFGQFATVNGSNTQLQISNGGPTHPDYSVYNGPGSVGASIQFTATGHHFALVISRHPAGGAFSVSVDGIQVWQDTCYGSTDDAGVNDTEQPLNRVLVPIPVAVSDASHTILITSLATISQATSIFVDGIIAISGTATAPNATVYAAIGDSISYSAGALGPLADPSLVVLSGGGFTWPPGYGAAMDSSYPGVAGRLISRATGQYVQVHNLGMPGDQLANLYGNNAVGGHWMAYQYLLPLNPKYISIMYGTNDAGSGTSRDYALHLAALVQFLTIALPFSIIAVATPPLLPAASRQNKLLTATTNYAANGAAATSNYGTIHTALEAYPQIVRSVGAILGTQNPNVRVAYVHEAMNNDMGHWQQPSGSGTVSYDGIHPNGLGESVMGVEIARALIAG